MEAANQEEIGRVLGRIPSGVFILTAIDGEGQETGMLCSWVQQASFSPPQITVAVRRERYLNTWLAETHKAAVSLVAEGEKKLLGHFGKGFEMGVPAFEGIGVEHGVTGVPVLSQAMGYLEGHVVGQLPAGDHTIYLLEIVAAGGSDTLQEQKPMVHVRKNGFNY